jgi:hypothetical protein
MGTLGPACSGDMDGDMVVGTRDLLLLLSDFDLTDCRLISDANGDCVVNTPDLLALLAAFGTDCMCNMRNGARPAGFPNQACVCNDGFIGPDCGSPVICPEVPLSQLGPGGMIDYSDELNFGSVADFHCAGVDHSEGTQVCGPDGQFTGDTRHTSAACPRAAKRSLIS